MIQVYEPLVLFLSFCLLYSINSFSLELSKGLLHRRLSIVRTWKEFFKLLPSNFLTGSLRNKKNYNFFELFFWSFSVFLSSLYFYSVLFSFDGELRLHSGIVILLSSLFVFCTLLMSSVRNSYIAFYVLIFSLCLQTVFFLEGKNYLSDLQVFDTAIGSIINYPILALICFFSILEVVNYVKQENCSKKSKWLISFILLITFQSIFISTNQAFLAETFSSLISTNWSFELWVFITIIKFKILCFTFSFMLSSKFVLSSRDNLLSFKKASGALAFYLLILVYKNEYF